MSGRGGGRWRWSSWWCYRRQHAQFVGNLLARCDEVGDDSFINIEVAFVLTQIADVVTLGQHTPDFRPQTQCVWQQLKNDKAVA